MTRPARYDVVVAGGGAGGVGAACAAALSGARTLLVERTAALGGALTARNVATICGLYTCTPTPRPAVRGIAGRLLDALQSTGGASPLIVTQDGARAIVAVDPESVKYGLDELAATSGVDVLLGGCLASAHRTGSTMAAVDILDPYGATTSVEAAAFVDATGDATLATLGGAAVTEGNGGRTQTSTLGVRIGGITADAVVDPRTVGAAIRRAQHAGNTILTSSTGFIVRLPISGDVMTYLADEDVNTRDGADHSQALVRSREQAWEIVRVVRTLPGAEYAYIVSTGPQLGIRESRHLCATVPVTDQVLRAGHVDDTAVALAAWPSEFHPGAGLASQWEDIGGDGAFGLTMDNITSVDTVNLFAAGRVLGGDLRAGASIRVLGTAFGTGHAAGVAAAITAHKSSGDLVTQTRIELDRQGALLAL